MRIFWLTLSSWLVAIVAFNFWADLPHRWHRIPELFTRNWTDAELWLTPEDFDETRFREKHIALIPRPDFVVIGSSTALSTDEQPLRSDINFYNASIAGATTSDYLFVWQLLKDAGKAPQRAIVWVDPMFFGEENAWQRPENARSIAAVERFLRPRLGEAGATFAWLQSFWMRSSAIPNELGELVNGETTWKSARATFASDRALASVSFGIVPRAERPDSTTAWTNRGVRLMPAERLRPLPREEIRKLGQDFARKGNWTITQLLAPRSIPKKLRWLLRDMKVNGVDVLLFQPPLQADAMAALEERDDTKRALAESSQLAAQLAKEEGAEMCDRLYRQNICKPTDYIDATHMVESCARDLMRSCLSEKKAWIDWLRS